MVRGAKKWIPLNWKSPPNVLFSRNAGVTSNSPEMLPSIREVVLRSVSSVARAIGFGTGSVDGDVLIQLPAASRGAAYGANCMAAWIPFALLPTAAFSTAAALRATRVMLRLVPQRNRGLTSPSRLMRTP